ncbi:class I SAM-dependent methyltransferase [Chloroflexota bacterium]
MFEYYNERAPEYEACYWGKSPLQISDPDIYKNDTLAIQKLLPGYISGKCIDIACGTGFWLPVYEKDCTRITLIDQSESVLAECAKKIHKLGIEDKTKIILDEIFSYPFKKQEFDSAFIGFLVSHLSDVEIDDLFDILKKVLLPGGKLAIIDSTWNDEFAQMCRNKAGMIKRPLSDGREFNIYKRYFEKQGLYSLAERNSVNIEVVYWGNVFFLATGCFLGT